MLCVVRLTGVDKSGTLVLKYSGGAMAVLFYSMDNAFGGNTLTLYGSQANLQVLLSALCGSQADLQVLHSVALRLLTGFAV